jgi:hypothetical protein
MYSRYGDAPKRPVRLPEHYGGSAFSQKPTEAITVSKREPPKSFSPRSGVEEKASPAANKLLHAEATSEEVEDLFLHSDEPIIPAIADEKSEEKEEMSVPAVEKKPPLPPLNFEGIRRLLGGAEGGADQDRLLLLGLILLLSRTEGDSDILLWLSLLLLCG